MTDAGGQGGHGATDGTVGRRSWAPLAHRSFANGAALEQFGVAWDVSLQENIPQDRLARVYAYDALGSFVALPVGEMAAGPLAGHLGVRTTLVSGAVLVAAVTAVALCSGQVRGLTTGRASPAAGAAVPEPLPQWAGGRRPLRRCA